MRDVLAEACGRLSSRPHRSAQGRRSALLGRVELAKLVQAASRFHEATRGKRQAHWLRRQRRSSRPYSPVERSMPLTGERYNEWRRAKRAINQHYGEPPFTPVRMANCLECGSLFVSKNGRSVCSEACSKSRNLSAVTRRYVRLIRRDPGVVACVECGARFEPAYGDKRRRFCSARCAHRYRGRVGKAVRRARKRQAECEPVDPIFVFERDGWRCHICGKDTPRSRRGSRYPNAPELDHRIPLSKGGSHSYANTQCACRACNIAKGDRRETGQLPLLTSDGGRSNLHANCGRTAGGPQKS